MNRELGRVEIAEAGLLAIGVTEQQVGLAELAEQAEPVGAIARRAAGQFADIERQAHLL